VRYPNRGKVIYRANCNVRGGLSSMARSVAALEGADRGSKLHANRGVYFFLRRCLR